MYRNLRKAPLILGMLTKVQGGIWVPINAKEMIYEAVVHVVLLYGNESLVFADAMMMVLEVFHHRISILIMGMTALKGDSG